MKKIIIYALLVFVCMLSAAAAQIPLWVTDRTAQFPEQQYVSALGSGGTAQEAKDDALSQIALYFNARVSVERNAHLSMVEGGEKHRSISSDLSVTSESELPHLLFTTPFKNGKAKEWFVCAYIERSVASDFCVEKLERCMHSVQTALDPICGRSPSFADMQVLCEEEQALKSVETLLEKLILLSRQPQDDYSIKIRRLRADIEASLAEARSSATFYVAVQGDDDGTLSAVIKEILVSQGMTLSTSGRYCVSGSVAMAMSENDVGVFACPNLSLVVVDETSGKSVYSFAKQYKRWGHKTADNARARALVEVTKDIRENFRPIGEI